MLNKRAPFRIDQATPTKRLHYGATESAGYVTVAIGYFISVFSASGATFLTIFTFTVLQILYTLVLWWTVTHSLMPRWQMLVAVSSLLLLTVASGLFSLVGIYLDWLLYFVTVGVLYMLLPAPRAFLITVLLYLCIGLTLFIINGAIGFSQPWLSMLAGFAFVTLFSIANKSLVAQRERSAMLLDQLEASNNEREEANTQLQKYANEVEELTIDRERTRMAREIHDTLGHYLTILSIQLETISKLQECDPIRAMVEAAEARRVTAQSIQEVRNAVAALRPSSIATLSLPAALTQLTDEFGATSRETELTLDLETQLPPLSPDLQLALYRVAQEALTNIRKHAQATKVLLRLRYEENMLELVVLNNGKSMSEKSVKLVGSGFGLLGVRERIELLGGNVTYGSEETEGYRVTVRVPLMKEKEE